LLYICYLAVYTTSVLSLQKAASILRAFSAERSEWGVRALAAHLSIPRATAHAYLASLTAAGFLCRTPSGKYRLSWHLAELSNQLVAAIPWFQDARDLLTRLALEVKAVTFLCTLEIANIVCIARERHPEADVALPFDVYLPITATASGKLLYAYADLTPPRFDACTQSSITTLDEWRTEVARVRRRGYAYSIEEWLPEQCTLALPYRYERQVVAAIGVQMTAKRYLQEENSIRRKVMDIVMP
jgi:DNA-binding IclR family transcriptional regulator